MLWQMILFVRQKSMVNTANPNQIAPDFTVHFGMAIISATVITITG